MKKITSKTRVRIDYYNLCKYLKLSYWLPKHNRIVLAYLHDNFGLIYTSKRFFTFFFKISDKAKYALFLLKHSDLLKA